MGRRQHSSTRHYALLPYTPLVRSREDGHVHPGALVVAGEPDHGETARFGIVQFETLVPAADGQGEPRPPHARVPVADPDLPDGAPVRAEARKSPRLNSSPQCAPRMPTSA